jgi:hypothetical protein
LHVGRITAVAGGYTGVVPETIQVEIPRRGLGDELAHALQAHGLRAELFDSGDSCTLAIGFADGEQERLIAAATSAIESWLSDRMLPLVVQRANGGCVVRPPGD